MNLHLLPLTPDTTHLPQSILSQLNFANWTRSTDGGKLIFPPEYGVINEHDQTIARRAGIYDQLGSINDAICIMNRFGPSVGLVYRTPQVMESKSDDQLLLLDLDGCRNQDGTLVAWAWEIHEQLRTRTYGEISPGRCGAKYLLLGQRPNNCKASVQFKEGVNEQLFVGQEDYQGCKKPGIELFRPPRFACLTGWRVTQAHEIHNCQPVIDWIAATYLQRQTTTSMPASVDNCHHNWPGAMRSAKNYVSKCPPAISSQGGHNRTYSTACHLVRVFGGRLTYDSLLAVLAYYNREKCEPHWTDDELRHKLDDAIAAIQNRQS